MSRANSISAAPIVPPTRRLAMTQRCSNWMEAMEITTWIVKSSSNEAMGIGRCPGWRLGDS
jgi:hypothetical protein